MVILAMEPNGSIGAQLEFGLLIGQRAGAIVLERIREGCRQRRVEEIPTYPRHNAAGEIIGYKGSRTPGRGWLGFISLLDYVRSEDSVRPVAQA